MINSAVHYLHDFCNAFKTKLFKQIFVVFLWDNFSRAIGLITTVLLIRVLPKEEYAIYTFFWTATMFFLGVVASGIDMAYVRSASEEYSATKKHPDDIFVFTILLCTTVFFALSPFIMLHAGSLSMHLFKNSFYQWPLLLGFVAAGGLFYINIISRYYQIHERYQVAGMINTLQSISFLFVFLALMVFQRADIKSFSIFQTIIIYLFAIVYIGIFMRQKLIIKRVLLTMRRLDEFIRSSIWLVLYFFMYSLTAQLNVFVISRYGSVADVASYGVALRYYTLIMSLFLSVKTVLKVRTSKIDMSEAADKQRSFLVRWMRTMSIIAVPSIVIIWLIPDAVFRILNGVIYDDAILPFKVLATSAMFSYILSPNVDIFRSKKMYFQLFCFGFSALVLNFLTAVYLIPPFGITGAAISALLSNVLINGLATLYCIVRR